MCTLTNMYIHTYTHPHPQVYRNIHTGLTTAKPETEAQIMRWERGGLWGLQVTRSGSHHLLTILVFLLPLLVLGVGERRGHGYSSRSNTPLSEGTHHTANKIPKHTTVQDLSLQQHGCQIMFNC